jgi:hypothetical protein
VNGPFVAVAQWDFRSGKRCLFNPGRFGVIQGVALRCAAKRFASKSTNTRTLLER